jgi:hypothetical protein
MMAFQGSMVVGTLPCRSDDIEIWEFENVARCNDAQTTCAGFIEGRGYG